MSMPSRCGCSGSLGCAHIPPSSRPWLRRLVNFQTPSLLTTLKSVCAARFKYAVAGDLFLEQVSIFGHFRERLLKIVYMDQHTNNDMLHQKFATFIHT